MRMSKTRFNWLTTVKMLGVDYRRTSARRCVTARGHVASAALLFVCLIGTCGQQSLGQEIQEPEKAQLEACPDPPPKTSGSHVFRRAGETIDIPITIADCQPVDLVLRWSNGGNNGSMFGITFLDNNNLPIYTRGFSGFMSGALEIPLNTFDPQPWFAGRSVVSVPTTVVIQAGQPFAYPANISYTVTRQAPRVKSKAPSAAFSRSGAASTRLPLLDEGVAMKLRTAEGRLLSQGQGSRGSGSAETIRFKLKELTLVEPREMEIHGRRETVKVAYRLTLEGGEAQSVGTSQMPALSKFGMIWLNDAPLPAFSLVSQEISAIIYDPSILTDGAEVAVSNIDGSNMHPLGVRLTLASKTENQAPNVPSNEDVRIQTNRRGEEGNEVVGIRSAVRVIGSTRIPLVQIELRTNRPFPPKDSVLQLQVGKRFFLNELTGDHTGRTLTLTLTQEMFDELSQGAEIVAFFDKPDRSGFAGRDIWHFGRLDKKMRK